MKIQYLRSLQRVTQRAVVETRGRPLSLGAAARQPFNPAGYASQRFSTLPKPTIPVLTTAASQQTSQSGTGSLFLLAAAGLGATVSYAHMDASPAERTLREDFVQIFLSDDVDILDGFECALTSLNMAKNSKDAVSKLNLLARKFEHFGHICLTYNKAHSELLIRVCSQTLKAVRKLENAYPAIAPDAKVFTDNVAKINRRAQAEVRLFEAQRVARKTRPLLEELLRNPLAVSTAGAVAAAACTALTQYFLGYPVEPLVAAKGAAVGFAGTGGAIKLLDLTYDLGIWEEFEAKYPRAAFAYDVINFAVTAYALAAVAGGLKHDPEKAQKYITAILSLKQIIMMAIPSDDKHGKDLIQKLDGVNENELIKLYDQLCEKTDPVENAKLLAPHMIDADRALKGIALLAQDFQVLQETDTPENNDSKDKVSAPIVRRPGQ